LQRAVSRLRARDLYLMCIIGFERIIIAAHVDGLSVVRCQRPIATSLLQATAHRGLLAIAACGCAALRLRRAAGILSGSRVLAVLVRVLLCCACCWRGCPLAAGLASAGTASLRKCHAGRHHQRP
jgi:hypothetical protein